jgi:hypothetical protein
MPSGCPIGVSPANLTTSAHFALSSVTSCARVEGEPPSMVPPRSAARALNFGSARTAFISALSLSTMAAGVFAGAPMPYHVIRAAARLFYAAIEPLDDFFRAAIRAASRIAAS